MLQDKASGVAGVTEEVTEVVAPILEALSATAEVEVSIPVQEAISLEKEKETSPVVANIEKEKEPSPIPNLEAMMTEPVAEPLAPVSEAMVTDWVMEPLTPISKAKLLVKTLNCRL